MTTVYTQRKSVALFNGASPSAGPQITRESL
jgi:hypothetical protein